MNKTVFITGTSSGLGKRLARHFAEQGWNVAATMRRPEQNRELQLLPNIRVIELDVTEKESIERAIREAVDAFGKIDVVVNNAGVGVYGPLELLAEVDAENIYAVNVRGVIDIMRYVIPHFRGNGSGKFINISSIMGRSAALPLGSLYNMTKFAVEGLTEGLYVELKTHNIDVHLVEPGGFASDFGSNTVFEEADISQAYSSIVKKVGHTIEASRKPGVLTDPKPIVKTVYDLAIGRRNAFRTIVGKDAVQLLMLRRLLPIRTFLGILTKRFT